MKTAKKRKKAWDGNIKVWKFTISLNTILTSMFGSIGCALVAVLIAWFSRVAANVNSIPKLRTDVNKIIEEQVRVRKEYHPPTNPNDPPPPTPDLSPAPK